MSWLGDLGNFELFNLKGMANQVKENPARLLYGSADPFSTKMWNKILGRDDKPLIDQWGGAAKHRYEEAEDAGINTGAGKAGHGIAKAIASFYTGGAAAGAMGGGAGAASGAGGSGGLLGSGTSAGSSAGTTGFGLVDNAKLSGDRCLLGLLRPIALLALALQLLELQLFLLDVQALHDLVGFAGNVVLLGTNANASPAAAACVTLGRRHANGERLAGGRLHELLHIPSVDQLRRDITVEA